MMGQKMITYDHAWPESFATCPPDRDFIAWLSNGDFNEKNVFHFGTGAHHYVGLNAPNLGVNVIGLTASRQEMDAYEELVIAHPWIAQFYYCLFGDIYLINHSLLPPLDIVTLFHLCEFTDVRRSEYGAYTDQEVCESFIERMSVGGNLITYPKSMAYNRAAPIFEAFDYIGRIRWVEDYASLRIYEKVR